MSDRLGGFFQGHVDACNHEYCCSHGSAMRKMNCQNVGCSKRENLPSQD